jgi:lysozyme
MSKYTVSSTGVELVKKFEGLHRLGKDGLIRAYRCPAGRWTIGYGHTKGVRSAMTITQADADRMLLEDLGEFAATVERVVTVDLSQNQFDALVSLAYNIGAGAFTKSTLLKTLNAGKYSSVPEQFMRWNKATVEGKLQPLEGLTRRRTAEAALFSMDTKFAGNGGPKMPQKPVATAPKPLTKSRTMLGASIAGTATIIGTVAEEVEGLITYSESLKIIFVVITLLGIGLAAYARWDDHRRGER